MNQRKVKEIRKLINKPDTALLVLLHKVYGDKTKDMDHRQVYQAAKTLYKRGYFKV